MLTFSQKLDLEAYLEYLRDLRRKNSGPYSIGYEYLIKAVQGMLARPRGDVLDYYRDIRDLSIRLECISTPKHTYPYNPTLMEIAFLEAYLSDEGVLRSRGRDEREYTGTRLRNTAYTAVYDREPKHTPTQVSRRLLNIIELSDRHSYAADNEKDIVVFSAAALDQGYRHEKCNYTKKGLPEDIKKAFDFYYSSARHGRTIALYCLGDLYLQGKGVTGDVAQARALFELAVFRGYREGYDGLTQVFMQYPGFRHRTRILYNKAQDMRRSDMGLASRRPLTTSDSVTYQDLENELRPHAAEEPEDTVTSLRAFQYHFSLDMPWRQSNLQEAACLYRQAIEEGNVSCIWDFFFCCKTQVEFGLMSPREFLNLFEDLERSSILEAVRLQLNMCFAYLYEYGSFFGAIERNLDLAYRRYQTMLSSEPLIAKTKLEMLDFVKRDKEAVEEELAKLQAITYMPRPLCAIAASYAAALPGERPVLFSAMPSAATATATATATAATATTAASSSSASRRGPRCVLM